MNHENPKQPTQPLIRRLCLGPIQEVMENILGIKEDSPPTQSSVEFSPTFCTYRIKKTPKSHK
jgi:hypothetical protein